MKIRVYRILGAALAALLPACGGGGGDGSGSEKPKKAFAVTLKIPKAGRIYTAPANISLKAVVANPASVAKVEFRQDPTHVRPVPNT